ncbi:hypothetical protein BDV95DRAFT_667641 [Massariosphaeria phaeospora]|uniref:Ankyrin repeat-containing domain protein n=1 Tax=Massariosphaeria phaeospora TaxID=100035 RepID=A0A7C8MDM6_9PLEO|nr:hypothetical protein BDV95DRAFT_667641 [Massariosphaeria phaeospora]
MADLGAAVLEIPLQRIYRDDDPVINEVWTSIAECEKGLKKLRLYKDKCGEAEWAPDTLKKKLVLVKKNIAYPFRIDTLKDLQIVLDRLWQNLNAIVQTLHLDTSLRFQYEAKKQTIQTHRQLSLAQTRQSYQIELLEAMNERAQQDSSRSVRKTTRMEQRLEDHSTQLSNVESKVDDLATVVGQLLLANNRPSPGRLKETCDTYVELMKPVKDALSEQRGLSYAIPRGESASPVCGCPKPVRHHKPAFKRRWISTYRFEVFKHLPSCPLFVPAHRSVTVGVRLATCRLKLGYLVDTTLTWSNASVDHRVACWTLVPWNSPAFQIIDVMEKWCYGNARSNGLQLPVLIDIAVQSLRCLFVERRASIRDVNPDGTTLAHVSEMGVVLYTREILPELDRFHHFVLDMGLEFCEKDCNAQTPLERWASQMRLDWYTPTDPAYPSHKTQVGLLDSLSAQPKFGNDVNFVPAQIEALVSVASVNDTIDASPLILNILKRSETGLSACLANQEWKKSEVDSGPSYRRSTIIYLAYNMTVEAAQCLWNAGFVEVNTISSGGETPIWHHANNQDYSWRSLELIAWLIQKGAQTDQVHPGSNTSIMHLLMTKIVRASVYETMNMENHQAQFMDTLLSYTDQFGTTIFPALFSTEPDSCKCACSDRGCSVIATTLRGARLEFNEHASVRCWDHTQDTSPTGRFGLIRAIIATIVCRLSPEPTQCPTWRKSVLRIITFDHLELTHTCHDHNPGHYGWHPAIPLSIKEVEDIQYIELSDIELLEALLLEFEDEWNKFDGILLDFIDKYWKPRMDEVLDQQRAPRERELDMIEEVGVVLEVAEEEVIEQFQPQWPEYGSFEYFEQRIRGIMDGDR